MFLHESVLQNKGFNIINRPLIEPASSYYYYYDNNYYYYYY